MFGANFAHLQERKTEFFFTTYGIVSCKDGYTNSYVVRMWYVVLIKCIFPCLPNLFCEHEITLSLNAVIHDTVTEVMPLHK